MRHRFRIQSRIKPHTLRAVRRARGASLALLGSALAAGGMIACGTDADAGDVRVEIATISPQLTRFAADSRLGVVWQLARDSRRGQILAVGEHFCQIVGTTGLGGCARSPVDLLFADVTTDSAGHLGDVVVSAPLGEPSAARVSPTGEMRWRYDGSYGHLGTIAIADLPDGRSVLVSGSDSITVIDFETGAERSRHPRGRAMLSADWLGDARREYVHSLNDTTFALMDNADHAVATLYLPRGYSTEPVITPTRRPFLVSSSGGRVDVFDTTFTRVKRVEAGSMAEGMRVVAATFLGKGPSAPFVAVFGAPGQTARSILAVFARDGTLIYREVLDEEHRIVLPHEGRDGVSFLLGGRGVVWEYRFPTL